MFLKNVGIVSDMDQTLAQLKKITRIEVTEELLIRLVCLDRTTYFRGDGSLEEVSDESEARIKLVLLNNLVGYKNKESLYLYFRRKKRKFNKNTELNWMGTYVGTIEFLTSYILQTENNFSKKACNKEFVSNQTLEQIYDLLHDKEHWRSEDEEFPLLRLRAYVKNILVFLSKFNLPPEQGIVYNSSRTQALCNTRLFSKYGSYIIGKVSVVCQNTFHNFTVIDTHGNLDKHGFEHEKLPPPVNISANIDRYIFRAELSDFDFTDINKLHHILQDRSFRFRNFPENYDILSLSMAVKNSVEVAVELSKTDPNYVHPTYSVEFNEVQFLIPLHLQFDNLSKPQCALVVRRNSDRIWTLQTVLDLTSAYSRARLIKRPDNMWLKGGI